MIDYNADPQFWQCFLKCAGFYTDKIDGDFGPNSMQAAHDFEQASVALANELGSFDGRSEANIQPYCRRHNEKSGSSWRQYKESAQLSRSSPGRGHLRNKIAYTDKGVICPDQK